MKMKSKPTRIVLDADVIIHFTRAEKFSLLLDIFPEYGMIILDVVYKEISILKEQKTIIDNYLKFFPQKIKTEVFSPKGESRKEYAYLRNKLLLGKGESACMIYCRDNQDVLGSSNLKDIREYCEQNRITYLTTIDFLYYAYIRGKITSREVSDFIQDVIAKGSKLPQIEIEKYTPSHPL